MSILSSQSPSSFETEELKIQEEEKAASKRRAGVQLSPEAQETLTIFKTALEPLNEKSLERIGPIECFQIINMLIDKNVVPKEPRQLGTLLDNINLMADYVKRMLEPAYSEKLIAKGHDYLIHLRKELKIANAEIGKLQDKQARQIQTLLHLMREMEKNESLESLEKQNIVTPHGLLYGYKGIGIQTVQLFSTIKSMLVHKSVPSDVKIRLLNFVNLWLKSNVYMRDLKSPELQKIFKDICDLKYADKELSSAVQKVIQNLSQANSAQKMGFLDAKPLSADAPKIQDIIADIRSGKISQPYPVLVQKFAQELGATWMEQLCSLDVTQLLNYKSDAPERAFNMWRLYAAGNNLVTWFSEQIVNTPVLEQRIALYKYFVDVAAEAGKNGDLFTPFIIISALSTASVDRMKKTNTGDQEAAVRFMELSKIYTPNLNYKNMRVESKRFENRACIPYLGISTTDVTFIKDGNPDEIGEGTNKGELNVKKCNLIARLTANLHSTVEAARTEVPKKQHQVRLGNIFEILYDQKQQFEKSLGLEPREGANPS